MKVGAGQICGPWTTSSSSRCRKRTSSSLAIALSLACYPVTEKSSFPGTWSVPEIAEHDDNRVTPRPIRHVESLGLGGASTPDDSLCL